MNLKDKKRLTQYYRWQFLRRNKEYQRQFDNFKSTLRNLKKDKRNDLSAFIDDEIKDFVRQYGINGIYNYCQRYPHPNLRIYGIAEYPVEKGSITSVFGESIGENQKIIGDYLIEERNGRRFSRVLHRKAFQVVVNCDAEWGDIRRQLKIWYDDVRKERRKRGFLKTKANVSRRDELDSYLKVADLHQKGRRNIDIARKEFPADFSRSPRTAEDKSSKYHKRAQDLIAGGYRRIVFY